MFFLKREYNGKLIFPNNYLRSIELFETERSDLIDWSKAYAVEFVRLAREVPYIVFPAFRLQETLRHYTLGEGTWKKINERLIKKKRNAEKEAELAAEELQQEQERHWTSQIAEWKLKAQKGGNKIIPSETRHSID